MTHSINKINGNVKYCDKIDKKKIKEEIDGFGDETSVFAKWRVELGY